VTFESLLSGQRSNRQCYCADAKMDRAMQASRGEKIEKENTRALNRRVAEASHEA
jgi:hypothetical protein